MNFKNNAALQLRVLAGLQFTNILDFVIMMPLGPHFMRDFHINAEQFGYLVSSYTVSAGIVGFLFSLWVDGFARRHTLLFVYAGFALATFSCAFAHDYWFLMFSRILAGAFAGVLGATILSIVSDLFVYQERGRAVSVITRAFSVASVVGVPIGLIIADRYGWQLTFLFIAVLAFFLWTAAFYSMPLLDSHLREQNFQTKKNSKWKNLLYVIGKKKHLKAFLLMSTVVLSGFMLIPYISPFLVGNVHVREEDLKYVYFFGGIFTYFTQKGVGSLSDRFGSKKIFTVMAMFTLIPMLILTNLKPMPLWSVIVITTFFMVFMSGRFVPAMTIIASSALAKDRGSFMSITTAVQQLFAGLASAFGGVILLTNADGSISRYNIIGYLGMLMILLSVYIAQNLVPYKDEPESLEILKTFDEELMQ